MGFRDPETDRKNHDIFSAIVAELSEQPPAYFIDHHSEHVWSVQKWNVLLERYEYLHPAGANCSTEQEAVEWMRADAENRRPDPSNFPQVIWHERKYYDALGHETQAR